MGAAERPYGKERKAALVAVTIEKESQIVPKKQTYDISAPSKSNLRRTE